MSEQNSTFILQDSCLIKDEKDVKDEIDIKEQILSYSNGDEDNVTNQIENSFTKFEKMSPMGCYTENNFKIKTEDDYKKIKIETSSYVLKQEHKDVNTIIIKKLNSNVNEINVLDNTTEKSDSKTDIHNSIFIIDDNLVKDEFDIKEQILSYSNGDDDNVTNQIENIFTKIEQMSPESCDIFTENIFEIKTESDYKINNIETTEDILKCEHKDVNKRRIKKLKSITNSNKEQDKSGICKQSFIQNGDLKNHTFTNNHKNPYICDVCQKSFTIKRNLRSHRLIHTGEEPHKCKICQKSFTQKSHLNSYMLTHTGEKPYKCKQCQKSFSLKHNLNTHILIHTGEKPYNCIICQKSFILKTDLNRHMLTHTGDKLNKCEICQKSFTQKSHLNTHMLIHTGEKPYKCKQCQKSFSLEQNLNTHMLTLTHTGEKPYKCKICQKLFAQKKNLNTHILIHTGEKPYKCDICQK